MRRHPSLLGASAAGVSPARHAGADAVRDRPDPVRARSRAAARGGHQRRKQQANPKQPRQVHFYVPPIEAHFVSSSGMSFHTQMSFLSVRKCPFASFVWELPLQGRCSGPTTYRTAELATLTHRANERPGRSCLVTGNIGPPRGSTHREVQTPSRQRTVENAPAVYN